MLCVALAKTHSQGAAVKAFFAVADAPLQSALGTAASPSMTNARVRVGRYVHKISSTWDVGEHGHVRVMSGQSELPGILCGACFA